MSVETQAVLVGVTGRGENTDALRFAIVEAVATGRPIRLVHVAQGLLPPVPPSVLVTPDVLIEVGKKAMHGVREELDQLQREAGTTVPVRSRVTSGDPGRVLADLSSEASVVVLQHRNLSRTHRLFTGSTVSATATHAHCPVVSVSAGTGAPAGGGGKVVVGLLEDGGPREAAETRLRRGGPTRLPGPALARLASGAGLRRGAGCGQGMATGGRAVRPRRGRRAAREAPLRGDRGRRAARVARGGPRGCHARGRSRGARPAQPPPPWSAATRQPGSRRARLRGLPGHDRPALRGSGVRGGPRWRPGR